MFCVSHSMFFVSHSMFSVTHNMSKRKTVPVHQLLGFSHGLILDSRVSQKVSKYTKRIFERKSTRSIHRESSKEPLEHECTVAAALAICQIHHINELQPMSTMFSLDAPIVSPPAMSSRPSLGDWLAWEA